MSIVVSQFNRREYQSFSKVVEVCAFEVRDLYAVVPREGLCIWSACIENKSKSFQGPSLWFYPCRMTCSQQITIINSHFLCDGTLYALAASFYDLLLLLHSHVWLAKQLHFSCHTFSCWCQMPAWSFPSRDIRVKRAFLLYNSLLWLL